MCESVQHGKCQKVQHTRDCVVRGDDQHPVDRRRLDSSCGANALPEDLDCDDGDYANDGAADAIEECGEELGKKETSGGVIGSEPGHSGACIHIPGCGLISQGSDVQLS